MQDIWDAVFGEVLDCEVSETLDFKDVGLQCCAYDRNELFQIYFHGTSRIIHATLMLLPLNGFKASKGSKRSWVMYH